MRKLNILIVLMFALYSCEKENNLPSEYYSIIGSWVADDSYTLGYEQSITVNENSMIFYIENSPTQEITHYIDIEADTIYYLSGDTLVNFYILYRSDMGQKKSMSFSYDFENDIIRVGYQLYDGNSGTNYGQYYLFKYRRIS